MTGPRDRVAAIRDSAARELRLTATMGAARLTVLVILYCAMAIVPVVMVYVFAEVVQAATAPRFAGDRQWVTVAESIVRLGLLLATQRLLELVTAPAQLWASSRVDIAFRTRLAGTLYRPAGISHGETSSMRGYLAIVARDLQGNTPGTAIVARFGVAAKTVAGMWCLAIVAERSVLAAAVAVVLLVARRQLQQRSFQMVYQAWGLIGPPSHRYEYWRRFHFDPAVAKEMRVFDLSGWSLGRLRGAAAARFAPVWDGRKKASRSSWLPFGIAAVGAFVIFVLLAAKSGLSGSEAAQVLAAGLTALRLSEPAGENLAIEHARTINAAAVGIEGASEAAVKGDNAPVSPSPLGLGHAPGLQFVDLRFVYPHDGRQVLNGIQLDVAPGSMLAIVGSNGAGKTTLVKLLARLYEPSSGKITVNGVDLRDIAVDDWRRHLAVMLQGFIHYDLSLKKNVQFGAAEMCDDDQFFDSVKHSLGIDDLVRKLPQGWETILGTGRAGGVELSGGEWQRIGLARAAFAVHAGRTVVVLDEPTAHLDAEAEQRAQEQLDLLAGTATLIVVSHRLSIVRHAETIAVVADGAVQEVGSHESLISHGGAYARMYAAQSERYLARATGENPAVTR